MEKYRIDENKKLKGKFAVASLTTCSKDWVWCTQDWTLRHVTTGIARITVNSPTFHAQKVWQGCYGTQVLQAENSFPQKNESYLTPIKANNLAEKCHMA